MQDSFTPPPRIGNGSHRPLPTRTTLAAMVSPYVPDATGGILVVD